MNDEMPEEVWVRIVTKKSLSAVRPESPMAQRKYEEGSILNRTKYIRADLAHAPNKEALGVLESIRTCKKILTNAPFGDAELATLGAYCYDAINGLDSKALGGDDA